jgi:hypothetical protein
MPSQLVALATQARNASGFALADEVADWDELPTLHIPINACLQLALPRELVEAVDVAKHVPHLAMMLATAFSQFDDDVEDGQPVTNRTDNTRPSNVRFMRHPQERLEERLFANYSVPASEI